MFARAKILCELRMSVAFSNCLLLKCFTRPFCSVQSSKSLVEKPDPHLIKNDYIGPPDKDSNLRPYVRCIRPNESKIEYELRVMQSDVQEWNQSFWLRHNKRFYDEKDNFVRLHNAAGIETITPDKMSEFYKSFLDKNRKLHVLYNMSWYLKNMQLLLMSLRVEIFKFVKSKRNNV